MSSLETDHRDVYRKSEAGFHVVRRSNRLWAGLSTDLIIEQVLMRSLKTSGGFTRGRGMTERRRVIWLLSMPACAEVNRAMLELTVVSYSTGEQNKDMTSPDKPKTRRTLRRCFFNRKKSFHNSYRSAKSSVNLGKAREVGQSMLDSMTGKPAEEYSFTKSNQAITFSAKSSVKDSGGSTVATSASYYVLLASVWMP